MSLVIIAYLFFSYLFVYLFLVTRKKVSSGYILFMLNKGGSQAICRSKDKGSSSIKNGYMSFSSSLIANIHAIQNG